MKLIIEDDEGRRTVVPLFRDELVIGRAEGSLVRLTDKDVSRRHARLLHRSGRFYLEDLNSFTGVRVNGDRVRGTRQVHEGDLIEISQYDLKLEAGPDEKAARMVPEPRAHCDLRPDRARGRRGRYGALVPRGPRRGGSVAGELRRGLDARHALHAVQDDEHGSDFEPGAKYKNVA